MRFIWRLPLEHVSLKFGATIANNKARMDMRDNDREVVIGMGIISEVARRGPQRLLRRRKLLSMDRYFRHLWVCNEDVLIAFVL